MANKSWEHILKKAEQRDKIRTVREKRIFEKYLSSLNRIVIINIFVGILAAFMLYSRFGWEELSKTILSWVIGITLVATILTAFINKYKHIKFLGHH